MGGNVGKSTGDGFWNWWSNWDMGTFWVETELISGVGNLVLDTIITSVEIATSRYNSSMVLVEYLQFPVLFSLNTIPSFVAAMINIVILIVCYQIYK